MSNPRFVGNSISALGLALLLSGGLAQTKRVLTGADPLGSRSTSPSINSQPADAPRMQGRQHLQFVSGSVVVDDGTVPPTGTFVERVCNGRTKREAEVDAKGNFSFQVGAANVIPEASDDTAHGKDVLWNKASQELSGPFGVAAASTGALAGCELQAALAGYRSSKVPLGQIRTTNDINVGTIVLRPVDMVRGTTVSLASMQAPKNARKAYSRAEKEFRKKRTPEAVKDLEAAVDIFPGYAAAWFELGQLYHRQQRTEEARRAYLKAVEADSNFVKPYVELARIAVLRQRWLDAAEITDRALGLDPLDFCEAYFFNSLANYSLNRLDNAEQSARKGQRLDGIHRYPQFHLVLANVLYEKHDVTGALEQLHSYLKYAPAAANSGEVQSRIRELEHETASRSDAERR